MAKSSRAEESSDDYMSNSASSEEEEVREQNDDVDEEELETVARSADDSADEEAEEEVNDASVGEEEEDEVDDAVKTEISKREKARLKEMQSIKNQKIQEILDAQNAAIDADMNKKGKGRLHYLLQQTELFAHFAKGSQSASQKKAKGR